MANQQILLQMEHITKQFAGVKALDNVCFNLRAGQIHALIGENGAGKSTLIKVLGGVYKQNAGMICINGEKVSFTDPKDSLRAGIGIIYQEFNLVPSLSIAENIYLGKELTSHCCWLDRKTMVERSNEFMFQMGFEDLDCVRRVEHLSVAQQQMVEISKALFNKSRILVMDEPTAVLTDKESQRLFQIIRGLKEKGVGIIYISHRLEEMLELADQITVLRDGICVGTLDNTTKTIPKETLVNMMVGRNLDAYYPQRDSAIGEVSLEVKDLCKDGVYRNISFQLKRGEILGIAGLVGAGRTEVVKTLFGVMGYEQGEILLDGKPVRITSPMGAMQKGIAFIPENRKAEGLFLDAGIDFNMVMANYDKIRKGPFVIKKLWNTFVKSAFNKLDIRPAEPKKVARYFSGGNQQKAIIAKWIAIQPKILILDEPTRGIDINAKAEIYKLMNQLVAQGMSIILVSSEMPEIIGMCDRVLVMAEGKIQAELLKYECTQEKIMAASSGINV